MTGYTTSTADTQGWKPTYCPIRKASIISERSARRVKPPRKRKLLSDIIKENKVFVTTYVNIQVLFKLWNKHIVVTRINPFNFHTKGKNSCINTVRICLFNLANSPLIQPEVACTSFSGGALFCLSRTKMYHIIQSSWRIMRQVVKDRRSSSLTEGFLFAMASINAAPISSRLVPYCPLRNSAFFFG